VTYRRVKDPKEIVVIFKSHMRDDADEVAYRRASSRMRELVSKIPGFLSVKDYTGEDGEAIDLIRFASEEALESWRNHPEHRETQRRGREEFYDRYRVQACRVFREYEFLVGAASSPPSDETT